MANNYNGKHICKNHPKVSNKGALILASIALASSLSVFALKKDNSKIEIKPTVDYTTIANIDLDSILSSLKSKYILIDEYGTTFEGLVFEYFSDQLDGLNNQEKSIKISSLLNDSNLETNIINYVFTNSPLPIKTYNFKDNPNIVNNINNVLSNVELMNYIHEYATTYGENEGKIIAMIAQNASGFINDKNPMGAGNKWYNLDSNYSVFNYDTNKNQKIQNLEKKDINGLKEAILYNILVSQSSVKQAGGNGIEAISYFKFGPNLLNLSDEEEISIQNTTDEILSYLSYYFKRNSFTLTTNYTLNEDNMRTFNERVQSKEYTYYVINDVINNLSIALNQNYNKNLS